MTALGAEAPNVNGLVYIAAFGLDKGESLGALLAQGPPAPAIAHLNIDKQGYAWLPEDDFVNHFAGDADPVQAKVMFAVQQPMAGSAFEYVMVEPAWKSLASWYLVAQDDQALPPDAQRFFANRMGATTVEAKSNHLAMVSHPDEVVRLTAHDELRRRTGQDFGFVPWAGPAERAAAVARWRAWWQAAGAGGRAPASPEHARRAEGR